ncbi:MAG: hypothetical protein K2P79_09545 [Sphingomonas sp.]|nr:hypothetical protein [Sphingomonas sp.]
MRPFLLAAIVLATPALAQTAPPRSGDVAKTALSNSPTPSNGPRAQQANQPANSNAMQANTDPAQSAPPMAPADATPQQSMSPAEAMPAPAPLDHYPICKANQFDKCMEPGNGARSHRRSSRR